MSDNSFEEKEPKNKFDIEGNDNDEEKNTLAKIMKEIEVEDPIPSTIKNEVSQNSTLNHSTIKNINNELKENKSPYLYKIKFP